MKNKNPVSESALTVVHGGWYSLLLLLLLLIEYLLEYWIGMRTNSTGSRTAVHFQNINKNFSMTMMKCLILKETRSGVLSKYFSVLSIMKPNVFCKLNIFAG